jgi:hypothetical protein
LVFVLLDYVDVDAYVQTMIVRAFLDDRRRGWWRVGLFAATPDSGGVLIAGAGGVTA